MTEKHKSIELVFEQPIVIMRFIGKTPTAEMLAAMEAIRTTTHTWKWQVTLCDLSRQTENISPETRKAIADAPANASLGRGTALFGANFATRTIATLLMNVMNLANGANDNPTKFFDTESAARDWLRERIALAER